MIESNNLLLSTLGNASPNKEILDDQNASSPTDKEDLSKDELDKLSPQSFVLLMAQVTAVQPSETASEPINSTLNKQGVDTELKNNAIATTETGSAQSILLAQNATQSDTQSAHSSNQDQAIQNNIALTWIDAEGFTPPKEPVLDLKTESYTVVEGEFPGYEALKEIIPSLKEFPIKAEGKTQDAKDESLLDLLTKNTPKTNAEPSSGHLDLVASDKVLLTAVQSYTAPNHSATYTPSNTDYSQLQVPTQAKTVEVPVDLTNSQWADQFAEQIVWLGHHAIKSALIKIHPEELGPIEINIKVVKDAASVNISTHNTFVKEVVDQAIPRLRDMMAEQGLNLSDVNIQSDANPRQFSQQKNVTFVATNQESEQEVQGTTSLNRRPPKGLIDYFA